MYKELVELMSKKAPDEQPVVNDTSTESGTGRAFTTSDNIETPSASKKRAERLPMHSDYDSLVDRKKIDVNDSSNASMPVREKSVTDNFMEVLNALQAQLERSTDPAEKRSIANYIDALIQDAKNAAGDLAPNPQNANLQKDVAGGAQPEANQTPIQQETPPVIQNIEQNQDKNLSSIQNNFGAGNIESRMQPPPAMGGLQNAPYVVPSAPAGGLQPEAQPATDQYAAMRKQYMESQAELMKQQKAIMDSLSSRGQSPSEMLMSLSKGFLTPTRGGSFGESMGNAMGSLHGQLAEASKNAEKIAEMKLKLYQEQAKLQQGNLMAQNMGSMFGGKGNGVAGTAGATGTAGSTTGTSALPPVNINGTPVPAQSIIDSMDPSLKHLVMLKMSTGDVAGGMKDLNDYVLTIAKSDREMSPDTKTFRASIAHLPPDIQRRLMDSYATIKGTGDTATARAKAQSDIQKDINEGNLTPDQGNALLQSLGIPTSQPTAKTATTVTGGAGTSMTTPPSITREIAKSRILENDKPAAASNAAILTHDPLSIQRSNKNTTDIYTIVKQYPQIVGLLQKSGWLAGLQAAADSASGGGIQLGRGYSVSLPVTKFLEKSNLNKKEQEMLSTLQQKLEAEFFVDAKMAKSILGPSFSNNDATLAHAPMATTADQAASTMRWAQTRRLYNQQQLELYNSISDYNEKNPGAAPNKYYKDKNSGFQEILNKYDPAIEGSYFNNYYKQHPL